MPDGFHGTVSINSHSSATGTGHVSVSFWDANGNHIGTWGANVGPTSLPGSIGGVYAEDPNRPTTMKTFFSFYDYNAHQFNNALAYAQGQASMTAGGAGEYVLIGANCIDFADEITQRFGYSDNKVWQFIDNTLPIGMYSYIQDVIVPDTSWDTLYSTWMNDLQSAQDFRPKFEAAMQVIDERGSEDEIVVRGRWDRAQNETYMSPISIDINNDGFDIISLEESLVNFDYTGNGTKLHTSWLSSNDGFLVVDDGNDGKITSGKEMFGGPKFGDAYDKLETFDSNKDGTLNADDERFSDLKIWIDGNSDGESNEDELFSLYELDITALELATFDAYEKIGDAFLTESSYAEIAGEQTMISDVFFRTELLIA